MRSLGRDREPKEIVRAGYDACGPRYTSARSQEPVPELQPLLGLLPRQAHVLDIGCGGGIPVTAALAQRATVTGVDISGVQIEEARARLPGVDFVVGDILSQDFAGASFDAVVALYTLFHLPREEHRALLEHVTLWLRPGGLLLATLADTAHPGYTEPDFFGVTMYWSHFGARFYLSVLGELGFGVLEGGALGHGYRDGAGMPPEHHVFVLAQAPLAWPARWYREPRPSCSSFGQRRRGFVEADVKQFLNGLAPQERGLVTALRAVVRKTIPRAEESIAWGGLSYHRPDVGGRVKGAICQIVAKNGRVRLDFMHGVRLLDPAGLLRGRRLSKRYVPIESFEDAGRPEVVALVREAEKLNPALPQPYRKDQQREDRSLDETLVSAGRAPSQDEDLPMNSKKAKRRPASRTAGKTSKGFTAEERAAMKEHAEEIKRAARRGSGGEAEEGESDVLAKIAGMSKMDRALAERVHALVQACAPALKPRTWYGMPAYAKDGKVVCFFQNAGKFKSRYATLGFSDKANLDEGAMWPTGFALKEWTAAVEKRITALVKRAVS